ncbi:MAG: hypothetical protein IE937_01090 [Gammaproteobacteria bacterium]|nr:hypothetical protein [Gammaproteobacteria bacterium]
MGFLFKSKTETTKQPFEQNPWKPQQPYLKAGFSQAQTALDKALAYNDSNPNTVANMNDGQISAIDGITGLGMNRSQDIANNAMNIGINSMGNVNEYASNAKDLFNKASADQTQGILDTASDYANDPNLQGQIDAALRDVSRNFKGTTADINAAATGSGNINSTRAGVMDAMAANDAQNRAADIAATMRGNAYQAGLDRAMQENQVQFDNMSSANSMLRDSGALGLDFATQGLNTSDAGFHGALTAQDRLQQQAQNEITGGQQASTIPLSLVQQYMQAIGANYGSNGFQTTVSKSPSPFQTIVGGIATAAGMGAFG